jgi:PII-like signaling protein
MTDQPRLLTRLTLYLGEDKMHGSEPLYQAILRKARDLNLAGATAYRGMAGFGRSTRLHSSEVLASEDLPITLVIIDREERVRALRAALTTIPEIGLIISERVEGW